MPHQCTNCGHVFEDGSKEMLSGCPDCGGNKFQYHPGDVPEDPGETDPPDRDGGGVADAVGRAANRVRDAVTGDERASAADDRSPRETEGVGDAAGGSDVSSGDAATSAETPDASTDEPTADATATGGRSVDATADATSETVASDADAGVSSAADEPSASAPETGDGQDAESVASGDEDSAQASARSDVVDRDSLPDAPEDGRVVQEPDEDGDQPDIDALREELNDQFESIRIVAPGQYELNLMELYDRQEYIIALQEDGQYVIEVPDAWDAPDPTDE